MKKIKIEFFHDVICSFCYPMSYEMRKLKELMPDLEIVHRSFALVNNADDFTKMFESRIKAKDEILTHWSRANEIDRLHRFNIDSMKEKDFLFPISMPALYACKAAYYVGGDNLYWDVFDALQKALFTDNLNIENDEVIFSTIKNLECDFEKWQKLYQSQEVKDAVLADLKLVEAYGINSVPTLIINKTHKVNGVYNYEALKDVIIDIQSKL